MGSTQYLGSVVYGTNVGINGSGLTLTGSYQVSSSISTLTRGVWMVAGYMTFTLGGTWSIPTGIITPANIQGSLAITQGGPSSSTYTNPYLNMYTTSLVTITSNSLNGLPTPSFSSSVTGVVSINNYPTVINIAAKVDKASSLNAMSVTNANQFMTATRIA